MNKQKTLEKLIFDIFDKEIEGTDIYNHDGSMWLIFTEERKWVVEFTKEKTLWYNYKHFNDILILFGMESSEGSEYIKKWYEDKFIFKPKIKEIHHVDVMKFFNNKMDDTIQNGVKNIYGNKHYTALGVEKTIQNGVKRVELDYEGHTRIGDTIQNGVKEVEYYDGDAEVLVNEAIENGIKETRGWGFTMRQISVEDTIENGVKHIDHSILGSIYQKDHCVTTLDFTSKLEDTIQNGVKQ